MKTGILGGKGDARLIGGGNIARHETPSHDFSTLVVGMSGVKGVEAL